MELPYVPSFVSLEATPQGITYLIHLGFFSQFYRARVCPLLTHPSKNDVAVKDIHLRLSDVLMDIAYNHNLFLVTINPLRVANTVLISEYLLFIL